MTIRAGILAMGLLASGICWAESLPGAPIRSGMAAVISEDVITDLEAVCDGDPHSECTFVRNPGMAGDVDVAFVLDLGGSFVVDAVEVINGQQKPVRWVIEIGAGPDTEHFRPLLGRKVNLPMWRGGDSQTILLPPSVARCLQIRFGGVREGGVSEIRVSGRPNVPERHLLCWAGDLQRDYLDKLGYLTNDLGATDLWIDMVETGFPQSNSNSGFALWEDAGAFDALRAHGLRYWLTEHEGFGCLVNSPEDLRDDRRWLTTCRQMRSIYSKARSLGFRGLVFDAEDYDGVPQEVAERYKDRADHVDAWCFVDETGYRGFYYQRGREVGQVIHDVWPEAVLIQLYEARLYVGIPGCRDGNYWWLKGIHDSGVTIWIATEKTYGAGHGELADDRTPGHLSRWFVSMPEFVPRVFDAYPFAARVLPGFHPWNSRTGLANYLPKYLDEQLTLAEALVPGYWIYNEGNAHAGDPRAVLDTAFCARCQINAQEYLDVFQRHPR